MKNEGNSKDLKKNEQKEGKKDDILVAEEVEIEEMAIDGICGVY